MPVACSSSRRRAPMRCAAPTSWPRRRPASEVVVRSVVSCMLGGLSLAMLASEAQAVGNAWHLATNPEPGIVSMRGPVLDVDAGDALSIYSGNQFQGAGNPNNQLEIGSRVHFRAAGAAMWSEAQLVFHSQSGNNKYFVASIPSGTFAAGAVVEYYLRIAYSDE